jgi:hypothetical protein
MFTYFNKKRGQSTIEYAVLIVIIIGALLSIQVYIKRSIQGRLKSAADDIGDQFSPGNTNITKTTTTTSRTRERNRQGDLTVNMTAPERTITDEVSNIINVDYEYWGK